MQQTNKKIIISGGGTGGHIFPAVAIARSLERKVKDIELLFVGAIGKMEMERIPAEGFKITGLPVSGIQRRFTLKNLTAVFNLIKSLRTAGKIISGYHPDVVIGTGGYASGPVLYVANKRNIPTLIQEQNSYPGITNKILARKADKICVAYEGMEKFFPGGKILLTGNPVREDLENSPGKREESLNYFNLSAEKKTLLVLGGSLGARTINHSIKSKLKEIGECDIQLIWQCGKLYYKEMQQFLDEEGTKHVYLFDFISRMDLAFAASDLVISRAGAGTISELCLVAKAVILVPSPNVAEDHQTKNAAALVENHAAIMIRDSDAENTLVHTALDLINDDTSLSELSDNIKKMAIPGSADKISDEVLKLCKI